MKEGQIDPPTPSSEKTTLKKPSVIRVNGVFCNCHYFAIAHSLICNFPLLKDISFNTKCLLIWCD